jgi:hypothetical protein
MAVPTCFISDFLAMWLALMSYLVLIKKPGTTVKKEAGIKSNNSAFSDLSVAE